MAGAITPIVEVFKGGSMEARENAAVTLLSLSVIDENKITIGVSNAIPALVGWLCEGSQRGRKDAATALSNSPIFKGKEKGASSNWQINQICHSSYPACRDSSKQNGGGASATMKTAQDLDVIVRTSELGEEVVSQAGSVVAMGDHSPWIMDTLLDAGSKVG